MSALELANKIREKFGEVISEPIEFRGEITIDLSDPAKIEKVCQFAKSKLGFDMLLDATSLDNYGDDPRWTLVYELYGTVHASHLRIKTSVGEEAGELPSISGVWATADWHEREIFDMMGIRFKGHPDLRRILMWDGYPHHPLRKDFPLAGKATDVPEVAFTDRAPLEGGPFVTSAGGSDSIAREPRVRDPEADR
ncbi:MAG: NADH-quinone oxidoreductase subunit C [Verrucomicrobiae bacterium]|nr:NADH-quinone oxidoreductase subunit C [Verrucomicrobiae bacterium]